MASSHHRYVTARAVIIENGQVLLFRRVRRNRLTRKVHEYYSIPGGEIDPGERAEDAVVRELQEEMGVDISLDGQIGHHVGALFEHHVFAAHIVNGKPRLAHDSEENEYMHEGNQYHVEWVPVERLTQKNLHYYAPFLPAIQRLAQGEQPYRIYRGEPIS